MSREAIASYAGAWREDLKTSGTYLLYQREAPSWAPCPASAVHCCRTWDARRSGHNLSYLLHRHPHPRSLWCSPGCRPCLYTGHRSFDGARPQPTARLKKKNENKVKRQRNNCRQQSSARQVPQFQTAHFSRKLKVRSTRFKTAFQRHPFSERWMQFMFTLFPRDLLWYYLSSHLCTGFSSLRLSIRCYAQFFMHFFSFPPCIIHAPFYTIWEDNMQWRLSVPWWAQDGHDTKRRRKKEKGWMGRWVWRSQDCADTHSTEWQCRLIWPPGNLCWCRMTRPVLFLDCSPDPRPCCHSVRPGCTSDKHKRNVTGNISCSPTWAT